MSVRIQTSRVGAWWQSIWCSLDLGNIQQWSIGVQQAITNDLRLDISFIQNSGYHLQSGYLAGNQPNLSNYTASANAGTLWDWVDTSGFSGFQWAALAPFPSVAATYGPLLWVGSPLGDSDYRSLQFNLTKQYSHGVSLQGSYNYWSSHGDTDTSFQELWWAGPLQDIYKLQQERHTISPYDMTHIIKGFVVYDLPFGKEKADSC